MKKNIKLFLSPILLAAVIGVSFGIKLYLILKYNNKLTLSSDDINYVKSAITLIKSGTLTYQNFNEPTVFIMPLYPIFLAAVFKIAGYGFWGLQGARIIQALISCGAILFVYFTAKKLFDNKTAILAAILYAFYVPNITTSGYFLTETLFSFLLIALIYISLIFMEAPSKLKFAALGVLWAIITLCRPTIALFPVFLLVHCLLNRFKFLYLIKLFTALSFSFIIIMSAWWIRNYKEYNEFIPLSAASGNPMLQGTYVDYVQTPQNIVYYKIGKNAFETNKAEMATAKMRIKTEFKKDFWGYLNWYTVKKTIQLWRSAFYWKEFLDISKKSVLIIHYILLIGIPGLIYCFIKNYKKHFLLISIILYFNITHCIYMAFDRYAFPLMSILSIYCAYLLIKSLSNLKYLVLNK
ncbi:MAG: glycosyltransferase family 39 protein [Bacillota bacterium]|nr:glycosyltransferase family 39 protein [Bacillota bacterium]